MTQLIQTQLIEAACEGDAEAIENLLLQCQPSMKNFARRYCGTAEDIEDAVQLSLWVVYQKIETLKNAKAFTSWMFTIVRNFCFRLLGEDTRLDKVDLNQVNYLPYHDDSEACTALKQDLVLAIRHLPVAYREIFILRDVEGFTAPEVAEKLNLSIATVKSRLHRARNIMREKLAHWIS